MQPRVNEYQQPVGPALPDWTPRPRPPMANAQGRYCRLEPLSAERHAADLFHAFNQAPDGSDWTYMTAGPFADEAAYRKFAEQAQAQPGSDPFHPVSYTHLDVYKRQAQARPNRSPGLT